MSGGGKKLDGIVGKHLIYTYDNGWQYEIYVKNEQTFSYRIHSGLVGGRWVTDQEAHIVDVGNDVFKISWDEPTGTTVSLAVNLVRRQIYGTIFFPRWVADAPSKTVCYQNQHLDLMRRYRDAGPTYPKLVIDEAATVTFLEDCGRDRNDVIDRPPCDLPSDYTSRIN
ncbi:MAG TPA: phenolic acid decarboxylase [Polyangiaceae bacterium]|jgi:phenolic acid decarboxylase|nr:phenolic acid decarboxylase [Polyangiaceae bacterium]